MPGPQLGAAEQPIATPHRNRPPGSFEVVGVDRHVRVGEKFVQPALSVAGKGKRLGQRIAGEQSLRCEAFARPGKEALDDRLRVLQVMVLLARTAEFFGRMCSSTR